MQRRTYLAALGATGIAGTAGCVDNIPFVGDEPLEFTAEPVSVSQSVLEETGYEENAIEERVIEETFEVADRSQDVVVTNWQAGYDRAVSLGGFDLPTTEEVRAAVFTALSTPSVNVLGRTFNPVGDMSSEELAEMVQDNYEGMDNLERVGEDTATIVGESTTVGEFEGEGDLPAAGGSVELTLHIAEAVESGDDLIVAVGGYPTELADGQRPDVFTMMEGVEHEG